MISIFECMVKLDSSVICTPRLDFNKAFSQKLTLFEIRLSRRLEEAASFTFHAVRNTAYRLWPPFPCSFAQDCLKKPVPVTLLSPRCMFFENKTLKIRLTLSLKTYLQTYMKVMEVIDLQSSDSFKDNIMEGHFIELFKCLPFSPIKLSKKVCTWIYFLFGST